jgi:phage baseplate assembly protein W
MEKISITAEMGKVNVQPTSTIEEVIQNIKTILNTIKGTVPLDRDFGIDKSVIDSPIGGIQARLSAEIIKQVRTYEPRASVTQVKYSGNPEDGSVSVTVEVKIVEA